MARLVLLGGGHSHIEVLRIAAEQPFPGEVTLVEPNRALPYTGMVPGFIAGLYRLDEILIPLESLCARAGASFKRTRAAAIRPDKREVVCEDGAVVPYDVLSIDVGSVLDLAVPGAAEHALPVRPLFRFVEAWQQEAVSRKRLAVVGAGAAGMELALALDASCKAAGRSCRVSVVGDRTTVAEGLAPGAGRRLRRLCDGRGIDLYLGAGVARVAPDAVVLENDTAIAADTVVWATGPSAPRWLRATGLALDARGYLEVDDRLRVGGRPDVYAAGDVASIRGHPRPKAGVYAVREAPVLAQNLRRALLDQAPLTYRPQRHALALVGTADGAAIAAYGPFVASGRWAWRWKDAIDRRFVARYR